MEWSSWDQQVADVERAAQAFTTQLRSVPDTSVQVPGMVWSVADLAAHLACLPGLYERHDEAGAALELPDDWAVSAESTKAHINATDPDELADLIEHEHTTLMATISDATVPRSIWGQPSTAQGMASLFLNEFIVHGQDLAALTNAPTPAHTVEQAHRIVDAMFDTTPAFIDPVKARAQPDGVYHVKLRGGKSYTWELRDAKLLISDGKPAKADAHLNTDPIAFILTSLGRMGNVKSALTGGAISYGKKPWRFLGLGKIVADGV